ncbi:MAG: hypothetical protein ACT4PV_09055 [Planctomycetaceae bacterium]
MRILTLLCLFGVFARAAPPEDEPATPAADAWSVEKPASNPQGEAFALSIALEPGMAHKLDATIVQDLKTNMGPNSMVMGLTMWVRVLRKNEKGEADVEMPLKFNKLSANGMDMLAMVAGMLNNPKLFARMDARGEVIPGTLKAEGMGQLADQMEGQIASLFGYLPPDPVKVGEAWEIPVEALAKSMAAIKGGKLEGKAYQTLEAIEEKNGARCARIKSIVSFTVTGDNLQMAGGAGNAKGTIRAKGEGVSWHGLDGYVRVTDMTMQMKMELNTMGMDLTIEGPAKITIVGGPEPFFTTTEKEGCGAKEGCGGGEMDK